MKDAREIAKQFHDHYLGEMDLPAGDDGTCTLCREIATAAQIDALRWALSVHESGGLGYMDVTQVYIDKISALEGGAK